LRKGLQDDDRGQAGDEKQVHGAPDGHAGGGRQQLDGEEHGGRDQQRPDDERDDVLPRRAPYGEELGVVREEIEERLREREGREDEQVPTGQEEGPPAAPRAPGPRRGGRRAGVDGSRSRRIG
jgi:hypothetical protein